VYHFYYSEAPNFNSSLQLIKKFTNFLPRRLHHVTLN